MHLRFNPPEAMIFCTSEGNRPKSDKTSRAVLAFNRLLIVLRFNTSWQGVVQNSDAAAKRGKPLRRK